MALFKVTYDTGGNDDDGNTITETTYIQAETLFVVAQAMPTVLNCWASQLIAIERLTLERVDMIELA